MIKNGSVRPAYKSDIRDEVIIDMWNEGLSCYKISDKLEGKLTPNAVYKRLIRLGLAGPGVKRGE